MNKKGGTVFSTGFQFNYFLPWNSSQIESTVISARHIRDIDLGQTYLIIENLLNE